MVTTRTPEVTATALDPAPRPGGLRVPGEAKIRAALLERNPRVPTQSINQMTELVVRFVDVLADVVVGERKRTPIANSDLKDVVQEVYRAMAASAEAGRRSFAAPAHVERKVGSGLGEILTFDEGRARLARYAEARPLESWAGPVAGPGEIERELGVARSTLNEWRRRGVVIGLLRGERKHLYPLEQFMDARPIPGIGDVAKVAPSERAAWLWLCQPHGALDMRTPLEVLRAGRRREVLQVAERDFL